MKNCDFPDLDIDVEEWDEYTGHDEWNAIYTVQLGELVDSGAFDWSRKELDWKDSAYDDEQYERICAYFIERFYYREISIEPFKEWAMRLHYKMVYELMPKYRPLYEREAEGINPLQVRNEYYKNRTIESQYPETLLSANADYITSGNDTENQRIVEDKYFDQVLAYADKMKSIDNLLLGELESMFVSLYTMNVNTSW